MHRPAFMPAPAFALKLLLGEMADALLLSGSARFQPKRSGSGSRSRTAHSMRRSLRYFRVGRTFRIAVSRLDSQYAANRRKRVDDLVGIRQVERFEDVRETARAYRDRSPAGPAHQADRSALP